MEHVQPELPCTISERVQIRLEICNSRLKKGNSLKSAAEGDTRRSYILMVTACALRFLGGLINDLNDEQPPAVWRDATTSMDPTSCEAWAARSVSIVPRSSWFGGRHTSSMLDMCAKPRAGCLDGKIFASQP